MLSTSIPTKFNIPFAKNAVAANINPIPTNSQIGITAGAASLNDGFPPLTFLLVGAGGIPPWGRDFNGLLNQVTAWNQWQQAGAPVKWDSAFSTAIGGYPLGAFVASTATLNLWWLSLVENNTSNPDAGGANWYPCSFATPIIGETRTLIGNAPGSTKTASWTVTEIVAKVAIGGASFLGSNLSFNFNGANVGAGGMDTGALPTSGDLSIYAIFNALGGGWSTLGTIACNGQVYTGSNLPATYTTLQTASALLWTGKCNASGIIQFNQVDRNIYIAWTGATAGVPFTGGAGGGGFNTNSNSFAAVNIAAAVPANARTCGGIIQPQASGAIAINAAGIGAQAVTAGASATNFSVFTNIPCAGQQVFAIAFAGNSGPTYFVLTSYTI